MNPKQVVHDGRTDTSLGKEARKEARKDGRTDRHSARNLIEINGQIFGCRPAGPGMGAGWAGTHRVFIESNALIRKICEGKFRKLLNLRRNR